MFIVCGVIMIFWFASMWKQSRQESAKPFRARLKINKYAEKEWNSSAWFIVVLISSLNKHIAEEVILLQQKYRLKQYIRLNKIRRLGQCPTVMQMVTNQNLKQHKRTAIW